MCALIRRLVDIWVNLCAMTQWMCSIFLKKKERKKLAMNLPFTQLPTCDQCIITYLLQSWIHLLTEIALQGSRSSTCSGIDLSEPKKKVSYSSGSISTSHVFLLSFCFHFCFFSFNVWGCIRTERYDKKPLFPRKHVNKALWNSSGNTSGKWLTTSS